jgi:hypothetical protein
MSFLTSINSMDPLSNKLPDAPSGLDVHLESDKLLKQLKEQHVLKLSIEPIDRKLTVLSAGDACGRPASTNAAASTLPPSFFRRRF